MADDPKKGDALDVMALLHAVHGSEEGGRGAAIDAAVHALERTHRKASLAMQQFARSGTKETRLPPGVSGGKASRDAEATLHAEPGREASPPAAAKAAEAPPPRTEPEVTALWRPQLELTRLSKGTSMPPEGRELSRPVSVEATQVALDASTVAKAVAPEPGAAPPQGAPKNVFAGRGATVTLKERTQTKILPPRKK